MQNTALETFWHNGDEWHDPVNGTIWPDPWRCQLWRFDCIRRSDVFVKIVNRSVRIGRFGYLRIGARDSDKILRA